MNERNVPLDFLRIISVFAVVWLHVSARAVSTDPSIYNTGWWAANFADAFSRWCVPVFVMISGALLLSASPDCTPIEFYKRRASRLLLPIIFWTVVYCVFREFTESAYDLRAMAESIVAGVPYYHLWFLYMILGLYLFTPFFRPLVSTIDSGTYRFLIASCFVIAAIDSLRGDPSVTFLPRFVPFIGYFLAGHYLLNTNHEMSSRPLISTFLVCGLFVALGAGALFPVLGLASCQIMYDYLNPMVIVMSICVFIQCNKKATLMLLPVGLVRGLAPLTLGVYLIHPLWLWSLARFSISGITIHPVIGIPVTTLLAFTLSVGTASLLAKTPLLRRTVS